MFLSLMRHSRPCRPGDRSHVSRRILRLRFHRPAAFYAEEGDILIFPSFAIHKERVRAHILQTERRPLITALQWGSLPKHRSRRTSGRAPASYFHRTATCQRNAGSCLGSTRRGVRSRALGNHPFSPFSPSFRIVSAHSPLCIRQGSESPLDGWERVAKPEAHERGLPHGSRILIRFLASPCS